MKGFFFLTENKTKINCVIKTIVTNHDKDSLRKFK